MPPAAGIAAVDLGYNPGDGDFRWSAVDMILAGSLSSPSLAANGHTPHAANMLRDDNSWASAAPRSAVCAPRRSLGSTASTLILLRAATSASSLPGVITRAMYPQHPAERSRRKPFLLQLPDHGIHLLYVFWLKMAKAFFNGYGYVS